MPLGANYMPMIELGRVRGLIPVRMPRINFLLIVTDKAICQYIPQPWAKDILLPSGVSDLASGRELVKLSRLDPEEAIEELKKRDGELRFTGCITLDKIIEVEVR